MWQILQLVPQLVSAQSYQAQRHSEGLYLLVSSGFIYLQMEYKNHC